MCGIAGFFSLKKTSPSNDAPRVLRQMVGTLQHRGPDSDGFFECPGVGLGMRRLRVIDLETGDQPISTDDKACWIVFNGEIYNFQALRQDLQKKGHIFQTHSDTEVILRLYEEKGADCVHDLNGMYAFAIYDGRDQSLFVARDPLGIKPLYYCQSGGTLVFGSEIKALQAFPGVSPALDTQAISHFLSLNYLPAPWTLFSEIRQLEGGHTLLAKDGQVQVRRFWNAPPAIDTSISEADALAKTKMLLRKSVQSQLVADVPVGAFLSGGLDSSSLVALIKEVHAAPVDTFSVGFREASYDETPYARTVARHFGTRHHEIFVDWKDLPVLLERMVAQLDQPLADPAAFALYQLSALTRRHVTVALSGDGADEIFVGYPTFRANRYLRWYQQLPEFLRERILAPLANHIPASTEKFSFDYRLKKFLQGARWEPAKAHYWWRTIFTDGEKEKILRPPFRSPAGGLDSFCVYARHFQEAKDLDFTSQCLWADLRVWLAGNNLHKVDAMTMAHSLEARVPYLDQELVEFLMRVPPAVKFKNHQGKYLLKKAMEGILPEEILHRRKAGWHVPFAHWFRHELKDYLTGRFQDGAGNFYTVFDRAAVQGILGEHFNGKANHSFKIWGLLILQEWFRQYGTEA